jgi:uncharacterized DUF497 family protein
VDIIWDEHKNSLLKQTRDVCFEQVAAIIRNHAEVDRFVSPTHDGQDYYIVNLNNYTHVVPVVINSNGQIALKTIFPSRKYHKLYGGNND